MSRFTSFAFFFLFLVSLYFLTSALFKKKIISIYAVIAGGFLPWYFVFSRISFDGISEVGTTCLAIFMVHRTFVACEKRSGWIGPILTGFAIAASLYTYPAARLLSLLLFCSTFVFASRKNVRKFLLMTGSFALGVIPHLYYSFFSPAMMIQELYSTTYMFFPDLSFIQKLVTFERHYFTHFDLNFLIFRGDAITLRHATGFGGQIFVTVFLLCVIGIAVLCWGKQKYISRKFGIFLMLNFLFSPTLSAVTKDVPHAIRSITMGIYIVIFSTVGLSYILSLPFKKTKAALVAVVFAVLLLESTLYVHDYFTGYPVRSIGAFGNYGAEDAAKFAARSKPTHIGILGIDDRVVPVFVREFSTPYTTVDRNPLPAEKGNCYVFFNEPPEWKDVPVTSYRQAAFPPTSAKLRCYL